MTIQELYKIYLQHPSVQTDTRKIKKGDIFFALKGPNFNGNAFAAKAFELGASYAVIDEPVQDIPSNNAQFIRVDDVLETLQSLAQYHREQFNIPFIAITGSNGKTTTKELVYAVLSSHFITYTTQGNLNNHIGEPLTLWSRRNEAQMAVIEMGANHQKEIEGYCKYAEPTHGIITNAGKAHLEGFGGIEGVKKGKGELFDYLRTHKGIAFIYADYDYLHDMSKGMEQIEKYGTQSGIVQGHVRSSEPFLEVAITAGLNTRLVRTQLVGEYNLPNVLCALAVGRYFGVPEEKMIAAIENYSPSNSRSQMVEKDANHIILDAYNANPSSMKAAIENFARLHAPKKVLMLGGMMELGQESLQEHKNIVALIQSHPWEQVVLVGGDFGKIDQPFTYLPNSIAAKEWYQSQGFKDTHILIKGSRSMQMEKILE
jgi:UDP-N-acetylmuramoyl-tripeptide--D-alanyl-D-alanine ligase